MPITSCLSVRMDTQSHFKFQESLVMLYRRSLYRNVESSVMKQLLGNCSQPESSALLLIQKTAVKWRYKCKSVEEVEINYLALDS